MFLLPAGAGIRAPLPVFRYSFSHEIFEQMTIECISILSEDFKGVGPLTLALTLLFAINLRRMLYSHS